MQLKHVRLLILFSQFGYAQLVDEPPASLRVDVADETGASISGATVVLRLVRPSLKSRMQRVEWVQSSDTSTVQFSALPPGTYSVCGYATQGKYLNPCEWNLPTPMPSLDSPGSKVVSVSLTLRRGAVLPIRLLDPSQLLARHEGKTAGAHVLMGVLSPGLIFHEIPFATADSGGRNYEITIPYEMPLEVILRSGFYRLSDSANLPLSVTVSSRVPVLAKAQQQRLPIVAFTIAGTTN